MSDDTIKRVELFIVVDDVILNATPAVQKMKYMVKPDEWETILKNGRLRKNLTIEFDDIKTGTTILMSWWQKLLLRLITGM